MTTPEIKRIDEVLKDWEQRALSLRGEIWWTKTYGSTHHTLDDLAGEEKVLNALRADLLAQRASAQQRAPAARKWQDIKRGLRQLLSSWSMKRA